MMQKKFCFTVDDNVRFLKELTESDAPDLFAHPYMAMYRRLHERYGLKVQLNLFYRCEGFTLSDMTDRFRAQWQENAHWLKLSFHSRQENVNPYQNADYACVYADCAAVHREICRFAGDKSLGETTTVHYCQTTEEGLRALHDLGVRGLLGLFGEEEKKQTSYGFSMEEAEALFEGAWRQKHGISFAAIDIILNRFSAERILQKLEDLRQRPQIRVMIHEQYFYADYPAYQPQYEEKLDKSFAALRKNGYESCFLEQMLPVVSENGAERL